MRRIVFLLSLAACAEPAPPAGDSDVLPGDHGGGPAAAAPASLAALVGDFADGSDTISVLERDGSLQLLRWRGDEVALGLVSDTLFLAAPGDTVRLARRFAGTGAADSLVWRGRSFARLAWGPTDSAVFRIEPLRPPEELLAEALAASPPEEDGEFLESDLVELTVLDPTIRLDVRYAGTDNFMGEIFYSQARAFLQRPAAEALVRAHRGLAEQGYGLMIYDGYRPWYVTKMFWDATPTHLREFVANPERGSRHNRGCAVDLTLFELASGGAVEMPSGYDEFSPRAYADYPGGTSWSRAHRALLRQAMEMQGFMANPSEWWHFDYGDWRSYRLANERFEELGAGPGS